MANAQADQPRSVGNFSVRVTSEESTLDGTITVTCQNYTIYTQNWIIIDLGNNQVVFNGLLHDRDDPDQSTTETTVHLGSDGALGNASYQGANESQATNAQGLSDQQVVMMN